MRQEQDLMAKVAMVWHEEAAPMEEQPIVQAPGRRQLARIKPVKESIPKPIASKFLKEEGPGQGIESASQVKLDQDPWVSQLVKEASGLAHQDEIIVEAAPAGKRVLDRADEAVESGGKSQGEDLGK
jgi:hypothetical protein